MKKSADQLERLLQDLASAVAADAGAGLYLDDGDGTLQLVSQTKARSHSFLGRWRKGAPVDDLGRTLLVSVPDVRGGVLVLERGNRDEFTPQALPPSHSPYGTFALSTSSRACSASTSGWRLGTPTTLLSSHGSPGLPTCHEKQGPPETS